MKEIGLIACCLGLGMSPANASPGISTSGLIANLNPRDVGFDMVMPGVTAPTSCTNPGLFRILPSAANYNAIVAVLITAFSTGKMVQVWAYSCDTDGATLITAAYVAR